jgi:hypothetical protein
MITYQQAGQLKLARYTVTVTGHNIALTSVSDVVVNSPLTSFTISAPIVFPLNALSTVAIVYTPSVAIGSFYVYTVNGNAIQSPPALANFVGAAPGYTYTSTAQASFGFVILSGGPAVFNNTSNWPGALGETLQLSYDSSQAPNARLRLALSANISTFSSGPVDCAVRGVVA